MLLFSPPVTNSGAGNSYCTRTVQKCTPMYQFKGRKMPLFLKETKFFKDSTICKGISPFASFWAWLKE